MAMHSMIQMISFFSTVLELYKRDLTRARENFLDVLGIQERQPDKLLKILQGLPAHDIAQADRAILTVSLIQWKVLEKKSNFSPKYVLYNFAIDVAGKTANFMNLGGYWRSFVLVQLNANRNYQRFQFQTEL